MDKQLPISVHGDVSSQATVVVSKTNKETRAYLAYLYHNHVIKVS